MKSQHKKLRLSILSIASAALLTILPVTVHAEVLPMTDHDLNEVAAKGDITIGSYQWNDDHQFDASVNKGALVLDGYVQSNATGEIIVNATQSAIATGVVTMGDMTSTSSGNVISVITTNEATTMVGGF